MALNNETKYQTLIETAPDAIFLVEMSSGNIIETNATTQEMLGYSESELADRHVKSLHPDENIEQYVQKFEETVQQGSSQFSKFEDGTQVYLVAKDGSRIPVDIRATTISGSDGPILFSVVRDISNMRRYENEIEQLAGELAVVNRIIRHDIRNDMTVITGWIAQLKSKVDEEAQQILGKIDRKGQSVIELTDNVKDYVEMIEGDTETNLESVLISDIIREEATATEQAYPEVDIFVGEIPTQPVIANSMLNSVFRNLFHNAVQHNDKSDPKIEVTAEDYSDSIVIHIADNGPGISEDRKSEIFDKDHKGLDSSGTGIGLFLVGELIEKFGGDVRVTDNEPAGTVFSIELRKP